ncbi:PK1L2-like protein [Mya arenaria]|uniref:PK1L2-like protein n=1 Tax=Mya arenaria TaxID=6604 RepID=A0ABY7DJ81_MYAAR|nr:PK1L2-like protein [Mya arenaria]
MSGKFVVNFTVTILWILFFLHGTRAWTLSVPFNATGVENGLYAEYTFADTPPTEVHCSLDMNDDEVYFMNVTTATPEPIDIKYDTFGYYDLSLICGEDLFEVVFELNKYIGTEIFNVDVSNGTRDLFIGVTAADIRNGMDVYFNVEFDLGLDVTINVTVDGHTQDQTVAANGSHIFILDAAWFTNGLFTVDVVLDNPISAVVQKYAIIAVQTGIMITSSSLVEYPTQPYIVMTNLPFNIAIDFTQGENVTIVAMLVDTDQFTQQLEAEICSGDVSGTHNFMFNTSLTGNYSLDVEVSNYASSYQVTFTLEIIHNVNSIIFNVSDQLVLVNENIDFTITVLGSATVSMGVVTCTVVYGDTDSAVEVFDFNTDDISGRTDLTREFSKANYTAGWFTAEMTCDNGLPDTIATMEETRIIIPYLIIVEEYVANLQIVHNSTDITYHPWSVPLELSMHLLDPTTNPHLYNITCVFTFPDDMGEVTMNGSSTNTSYVTIAYKFNIGNQSQMIQVNCSNRQTFQLLELNAFVYYDCWQSETFFTSGKYPAAAIQAYTDTLKEIKAVVLLTNNCGTNYKTTWTIYDSNNNTDYTETTESVKTTWQITANTTDAGVYRYELKTQFIDHTGMPHSKDHIYVKFIYKQLVVSLDNEVNDYTPLKTVFADLNFTVNSLHSYDPASGLSSVANKTSVHKWSCLTGPDLSDDLVKNYVPINEVESIKKAVNTTSCDNLVTTDRTLTITPGNYVTNQWYIFTHVWTKGDRTSNKSQAIKPIDKRPLNLQIVCKGVNCKTGEKEIVKLISRDIEVNVAILAPVARRKRQAVTVTDINNNSATYQWKVEMNHTSQTIFNDKTNHVTVTRSVGLSVPKSIMSHTNDNYPTLIRISVDVSLEGFATTSAVQTFYKNLPPYGGTCHIQNEAHQSITSVRSGLERACYNCRDWLDEGVRTFRDTSLDSQGGITYQFCQLFYNTTTNLLDNTATICTDRKDVTVGCVGVKFPSVGFRTEFEVRVADEWQEPYASISFKNITVKPAIDADADEEAQTEALNTMLETTVNNLANLVQQENVDAIAMQLLVDSSNIAETTEVTTVVDENPTKELFVIPTDGSEVDVGAALESLVSEPVFSSATIAKQNLIKASMDALRSTVSGTGSTEKLSKTPETATLVARSLVEVTKQKDNNFKENGLMADIASTVADSAGASDEDTPATGELMIAAIDMFTKAASKILSPQVKNKEDARREFYELLAFSGDDLDEFSASPDERAMKLSRAQTNMDMKVTARAPSHACEGCQKLTQAGDAFLMTLVDTVDKIKTLHIPSGELYLGDALKSVGSNNKASASVSETAPMNADDRRSMKKLANQKKITINTNDELHGKISIKTKGLNTDMTRIDAGALVQEDDASGPNWTYLEMKLDRDTVDNDIFITLKSEDPSVVAFNVYLTSKSTLNKLNYDLMKTTNENWVIKVSPAERANMEPTYGSDYVGLIKYSVEPVYLVGNSNRTRRDSGTGKVQPFNIGTTTTACLVWDNQLQEWTSAECEGDYNPDTGELDCSCRAMKEMTLANSFYVPPNRIDFSNVFLKFSPLNQAAVMATLIIVLLIYLLIIVWARRQDRIDLLKDNYFYVVKVITGMRPGAGTRSKVCFVVAGEEMDTGVRELSDGIRKEYGTGSVLNFLMSTTVYLGDLEYIRLWHDNSGGSNYASWYLSRVEIQDVQRDETFIFQAERWLAIDKDDGMLERVLPVCKTENLNKFKNRFFLNAKDNLAESHMWVSIAYRPQSSNFTRCQRASCALVFIMLTMISNAMFFQSSGEDGNIATPNEITLGPFRFTLQQGLRFPHWVANVAWVLVFICWFLPAFFVMLYSMEWGKNKSEEWVTTFLLSFFESVFCLDPIKVGVMALTFAVIFRSTKDSSAVINRSTIMRKYSSTMRGRSGGIRLPAPPLDEDQLSAARQMRQRELLMKRAFRDCITNLAICWILFSIAYSNRDSRSYLMHKETMEAFIQPIGMPQFESIRTISDFYQWMNESVIPNMFPQYEPNGVTLHWRHRQFIHGGAKYRVDHCDLPYIGGTDCYKKYSPATEEADSYCIGWVTGSCDPKEKLYQYTSDAWKFTSALDIWGFPLAGYYTTYGGGGYIAKFDVNRDISQNVVDELYSQSWIDRQSRSVILEFTLYCINANIFTYNMFMVEFPETGGAFPFYLIYPMRVYQHLGPAGIYTLACEVILVLYILIITIMAIIGVCQQKKEYFNAPWQVYDIVFIVLGYVAIAMYAVRTWFTNESLAIFKEDKKAFVNFYHIALWNQMLVLLIGVLCFMATLRMLNVLGYNKRIGAVARVFTKAASDLLWFGVFFTFTFTCYCVFGWLLFGAKLKSYKNVFTVMGTLFISMIGKSRFTEIDNTDPIMSKIYFIIFIFFMVYLMLTMFLAMLSKAIDEVHHETKANKDDEMVDYLLKKMKGLLSYGGRRQATKGKSAAPPAPWNQKRTRRGQAPLNYTNRNALEDIRDTLQGAMDLSKKDFSTPEPKHHKTVSFRKCYLITVHVCLSLKRTFHTHLAVSHYIRYFGVTTMKKDAHESLYCIKNK